MVAGLAPLMKLATTRTLTKRCPRTGRVYVVTFGFDGAFAARHKQRPYLTLTGEEWDGEPMRSSERNLVAMGRCDDMIAREFPELAPVLPFAGMFTDGPMHYEANAVYLAGDRDHNGLRKGERRQLRNGRTKLPVWELRVDDGTDDGASLSRHEWRDAAERPPESLTLRWFPVWTVGEGKARELDAARRVAVWPDATDEELSAEPEQLRAALVARAPALLDRFRAACAACGIAWPNDDGTVS